MAVTWADLVAFASGLPEVTESTSYGTPALKVAGKLLGRLRTDSDGGFALKCAASDKEALVSGDDAAYYTTPHYDGYNYVLVHLVLAERKELFELVEDAWRMTAPQRARAMHPD